jgi:peptidoglycan/LPS O-acetylase OafA/YrhL
VHRSYGKAVARWLEAPFHRALVALPCLACLWLLLAPATFGFENVQLVHVFAWGSVTSLMYFGLVPLAIYGEGWVCAGLSLPIFRRLATLGYGVYLVHIPVINHVLVPMARAAQQRHWSMLIVWPTSVAGALLLSLALAYALHVAVEKPSLRLRERLAA